MKIIQLTLVGYKRLLFDNVSELTINFNSPYQLILGTNGCGKSSLLYELTPYPADHAQYNKPGYKEIQIEYKKDTYTLRSDFRQGKKHYFIKNGVELNHGNTLSIQKELVQKEFNISQDIHELLIGKINFTELPSSKRREWMTKLASVDFTYALKMYQKLSASLRDTQGALKHTKQRITNETNKLMALGNLTAVDQKYAQLHQELNGLFKEKNNYSGRSITLKSRIDTLLEEIKSLSHLLVKKLIPCPMGYSFDSIESIEKMISDQSTERKIKDRLRHRIGSEWSELTQLLKEFSKEGIEDIDSLKREIEQIKSQITQLTHQLTHWKTLKGHPLELNRCFKELIDLLFLHLKALPPNPGKYLNKTTFEQKEQERHTLLQKKDKEEYGLRLNERKLNELNQLDPQTCPQCHWKWVPGKSEQLEKELKEGCEQLKVSIEHTNKAIDALTPYLDQFIEYKEKYMAIRHLTVQYPQLNELWSTLLTHPSFSENPNQLIGIITQFGHELEVHCERYQLNERLTRLEQLVLNDTKGQEISGIKKRIDTLEKDIECITKEMDLLSDELSRLEKYRNAIKHYMDKYHTLLKLIEELNQLKEDYICALRSEGIERVIVEHQNELAVLQTKKTEKQTLLGIIEDLKKDQVQLEHRHKVLSIITSELSPNDGLIAEQLTGFIEHFIAHVNKIIQSIWSYDLRVKACGLEEGDLDYKFPLVVHHEGLHNVVSDINKASEGQKEVINFAFKLISMMYLGLQDYPVYLDEMGRTFDESHRTNAMHFIKRLIDSNDHSQLFMISHFAVFHGSFTNAEIIVLDQTNIVVPKEYNQHVTLG